MSKSKLVLTFMPPLVTLLLKREKEKGFPPYGEVLAIRDQAVVVALSEPAALDVARKRGYRDIDPDHCWEQWQSVRIELLGIDQGI